MPKFIFKTRAAASFMLEKASAWLNGTFSCWMSFCMTLIDVTVYVFCHMNFWIPKLIIIYTFVYYICIMYQNTYIGTYKYSFHKKA